MYTDFFQCNYRQAETKYVHKPSSHRRHYLCNEFSFCVKQGPVFIQELQSLFPFSFLFFLFQHPLPLSLNAAEKIALLLLRWAFTLGLRSIFQVSLLHKPTYRWRAVGVQNDKRKSRERKRGKTRAVKHWSRTKKEKRREEWKGGRKKTK